LTNIQQEKGFKMTLREIFRECEMLQSLDQGTVRYLKERIFERIKPLKVNWSEIVNEMVDRLASDLKIAPNEFKLNRSPRIANYRFALIYILKNMNVHPTNIGVLLTRDTTRGRAPIDRTTILNAIETTHGYLKLKDPVMDRRYKVVQQLFNEVYSDYAPEEKKEEITENTIDRETTGGDEPDS
jgi:predicted ribosome quality control (RQC) complex YloA/Tae2 family protein